MSPSYYQGIPFPPRTGKLLASMSRETKDVMFAIAKTLVTTNEKKFFYSHLNVTEFTRKPRCDDCIRNPTSFTHGENGVRDGLFTCDAHTGWAVSRFIQTPLPRDRASTRNTALHARIERTRRTLRDLGVESIRCQFCRGHGTGTDLNGDCIACHGTGTFYTSPREYPIINCYACSGTGNIDTSNDRFICDYCHGSGRLRNNRPYRLPPAKTTKLDLSEVSESDETCRICYVSDISMVYEACAHMTVCETCAPRLDSCPECRADGIAVPIKSVITGPFAVLTTLALATRKNAALAALALASTPPPDGIVLTILSRAVLDLPSRPTIAPD